MEFLDVVDLIFMSNNEFPRLLKRDIMCLTPLVEELSSADTKRCFERIWGVIEPWITR